VTGQPGLALSPQAGRLPCRPAPCLLLRRREESALDGT
jgi:hypothetical protein